jgi:tetratricopeptide (TPR) repeat protein
LRVALAVGAPVVVLAVLTLGLRLAGYGYPTGFFVRLGDSQTLTTNRRFGWQFMRREVATQPFPLLMAAQKPPGVLRIFILGESAAQGTPAPAFGFGRILEVMLGERFPDRKFEVVNVAMRGINSHVVLPIARECVGFSPDLFLVYMGNNEMIGLHSPGPRGINWACYPRLIRFGQWVKGLRLAQAFDAVRAHLASVKGPEQDMEFFRRARLAADDPRREPVYENFRANLAAICQAGRVSGAKVILSTVAVNLRDFPPLASMHRLGLAPADLTSWDSAWARGTNAEAHGQCGVALTNYLEALRLDDHFAELHFHLARCALEAGQTDVARRHFELARDWDALQFRSDHRLNQTVREARGLGRDAGLLLVDAERAFEDPVNSEQGIPGDHLFCDHVHPTFDGDYLLARLFLPAVAQGLNLGTLPPLAGSPGLAVQSREDCAKALAFTEWDEISVTAAMLRLTAKPPFLDQLEHSVRQARGEQTLDLRGQQFQRQPGLPRAKDIYREAITRRPSDWQSHFNFGSLLADFGDKPGAAAEFASALRLMPVFPQLHMLLGQALWDEGRRQEAVQELKLALRLDPDYTPAQEALAETTGRHD